MAPLGRPLVFEDRTGQYSTTDLDDIYDRMFFRVAQHSVSPSQTIILIYDRARRSNRRNNGPETIPPSVVLDFTTKVGSNMGTVTFERMPPIPIKEFLKKIGTFGRWEYYATDLWLVLMVSTQFTESKICGVRLSWIPVGKESRPRSGMDRKSPPIYILIELLLISYVSALIPITKSLPTTI